MNIKYLHYEVEKQKQGFTVVIGCDEVGRGSLAGPVIAAAVLFDPLTLVKKNYAWAREVKDSKLLSAKKRTELALHIKQSCTAWGIGTVTPKRIDKINIHRASLAAMERATQNLMKARQKPNDKKVLISIDGKFTLPGVRWEQEAIVDGDAKVFSISSASILAKVYRDELMTKADIKFPQYNLARHKGYGTVEHREAIKRYGLSPIHRITFCGNII